MPITNAIRCVLNGDTSEMEVLTSGEINSVNLPNIFLFLDNVVTLQRCDEETMSAIVLRSFNLLTKGLNQTQWIGVVYNNGTFLNEDTEFSKEDKKEICKNLGFKKMPKSMATDMSFMNGSLLKKCVQETKLEIVKKVHYSPSLH